MRPIILFTLTYCTVQSGCVFFSISTVRVFPGHRTHDLGIAQHSALQAPAEDQAVLMLPSNVIRATTRQLNRDMCCGGVLFITPVH